MCADLLFEALLAENPVFGLVKFGETNDCQTACSLGIFDFCDLFPLA
jgi:hypothetical protein